APKRGVPEREIAAVAAEDIPSKRQHCPEQDLGQDELVVGILDDQRDGKNGQGNARYRPALTARGRGRSHVRSLRRPNIPCGRKKIISKKTTKIAVFCS